MTAPRSTSERIEAALTPGDLRAVKVTMTRSFRAECEREADRNGWALDTWIVAAMVHMLDRQDDE